MIDTELLEADPGGRASTNEARVISDRLTCADRFRIVVTRVARAHSRNGSVERESFAWRRTTNLKLARGERYVQSIVEFSLERRKGIKRRKWGEERRRGSRIRKEKVRFK